MLDTSIRPQAAGSVRQARALKIGVLSTSHFVHWSIATMRATITPLRPRREDLLIGPPPRPARRRRRAA